MKSVSVLALCSALVFSLMVSAASADPRMEIKYNFCHFILDPVDTDNEVFAADCEATITVEKKPETEAVDKGLGRCEDRVATGYAKIVKRVPETMAPVEPGETLVLTSYDSESPCVMVESNGRAYKSYSWVSFIKVGTPNENGMVKVLYRLMCLDGE